MTKLEAHGPGLVYHLKYAKANDSDFGKPVIIKNPEQSRFTVPNPGYYEKWKFQIQAKNDIDFGPLSDIVEAFSGQDAPKGKPTNVKIVKVEARSVQLSWDRVDIENNRGNVDGYKVIRNIFFLKCLELFSFCGIELALKIIVEMSLVTTVIRNIFCC